MKAFRLSLVEFARTPSDAFSGVGGIHFPGRWHHAGGPVVYVAESVSLAALERLVHLKRTADVRDHVYYETEVPDAVIEVPATLPSGWNAEPPTAASRDFGSQWLREGRSVAIRVPSVVTRTEFNLVLNPRHPDFKLSWVTRGPITFVFDTRLLDLPRPPRTS